MARGTPVPSGRFFSREHLLRGLDVWWIRFSLDAVYATMYVRDHTRPLLHEAFGLASSDHDFDVFRITSEISKQVFPPTLDTDGPSYRAGLATLHRIAAASLRAKNDGGFLALLKRGACAVAAAATFLRLLFVPVIPNALPATIASRRAGSGRPHTSAPPFARSQRTRMPCSG